jgi:4-amino-4-deoxy-L-arabinose transferase-like glycosyltransferase
MDNQSRSPSITIASRRSLVQHWLWLVVLLVILFTSLIRVRLLDMPLERDEGEYAYAGQLILQGIPPYELAYNMKLPGTYFAYAAGMAVFGETTSGIHLTLLAVNSLTIVFVFFLGRKLFGTVAGVVAGASYGVLSVSPAVMGMAAHATQFVVLFAVPGMWLFWKGIESGGRKIFFFSGLLFGLAFLMKQQGICFGLFGSIFLLGQAVRNKFLFTRDFTRTGLVFGLGMILPFIFLCLSCAVAGDFGRFWFWTFTYAETYAAHVPLSYGMQLLCDYLRDKSGVYAGFWILAGAGLVLASRDQVVRKQMVFAIGLLFFSFLGTSIGLYFREHYFVLLLPAFAILVGLAVDSLQRGLSSQKAKIIPLALFAAVVGWNIWLQKNIFFQLSPTAVSRVIYGWQNPFIESIVVAQFIREHSAATARVAVVGSEPEIYFYAQRHSATGYIYTYPLMETQPYAVKMQREMISEIEANKPEYLVLVMYGYSWLYHDSSATEIFNWVTEYTKKSYETTGIINTQSNGQTVYLWGDNTKKYQVQLDQFMMIYKRKPDSENVGTH